MLAFLTPGDSAPLSCRTFPHLWGRSAVIPAFANHHRRRVRSAEAAYLPLVGEMSGMTRGAKDRYRFHSSRRAVRLMSQQAFSVMTA